MNNIDSRRIEGTHEHKSLIENAINRVIPVSEINSLNLRLANLPINRFHYFGTGIADENIYPEGMGIISQMFPGIDIKWGYEYFNELVDRSLDSIPGYFEEIHLESINYKISDLASQKSYVFDSYSGRPINIQKEMLGFEWGELESLGFNYDMALKCVMSSITAFAHQSERGISDHIVFFLPEESLGSLKDIESSPLHGRVTELEFLIINRLIDVGIIPEECVTFISNPLKTAKKYCA